MAWITRENHPRKSDFVEPPEFSGMGHFRALMLEVVELGLSDIFLQTGYPIIGKLHGRTIQLTERRLAFEECMSMLVWATGNEKTPGYIAQGKEARGSFVLKHPTRKSGSGGEVTFRFRVNGVRSEYRAGISTQIVMRLIQSEPATLASVGLDEEPELLAACTPDKGLVYMTGATGSGKSTTFSAILRNIFEGDTPIKGNIVIIDDPIEQTYDVLQSHHSFPVQMEVGRDTESFEQAIKSMMRHDPELIVVQETRDPETARATLQVALTGHLAYTTLHVNDVPSIPARMLTFFPLHARDMIMFDVLNTARVFMNQILVPSLNGGRVALREYLILDDEMRADMIRNANPDRITSMLRDLVMERGQPMVAAAKRALDAGKIDSDVYRRIAHQ